MMKPDKRLANTKVYVAGKSKEIQKKAFRLGYGWGNRGEIGKEIYQGKVLFLYFDKEGGISYGLDVDFFFATDDKEVTADYILSLEPEPECPFKPFDKVLVRDDDNHAWMPNFFSYKDDGCDYPFCMINGAEYRQCIPYEGNEHLAFTNDSPKQ